MKKLNFILVVMMILAACSKHVDGGYTSAGIYVLEDGELVRDHDDPTKPLIYTLEISKEAQTVELRVVAPKYESALKFWWYPNEGTWYKYEIDNDEELAAQLGYPVSIVRISVSENDTYDDRSIYVTALVDITQSAQIEVLQQAEQ
ncbi:MAG: hypothetical protein ACI3ZC_07095 [Candidatus Cryptobacteroides sp.]